MGETFPLFQSAIQDSTPFSGTMADTSTPTPEGVQPQVPETPQANEMPGNSGDRVRLQKIQQDRSLIQQQLQTLATMRWVNKNHWNRRFNLALTGRDMEPAQMLYKRHEAMADLLRIDAGLAQEERLLTTPNPQDLKDKSDAAGRARRQAFVDDINGKLKIFDGSQVAPDRAALFVESGYGLVGTQGGDSPVEQIIKEAQVGEHVGEEGVKALGLTGRAGTAATYGARQAEIERKQKDSEKSEKGKFAGFDSLAQLSSAVESTYDNIAKTLEKEEEVEGYYQDPRTLLRVKGKVFDKRLSPQNAKIARKLALAQFKGAEEWLPNYVEQGPDPNQRDVQRGALKDKAQPKK